LKNLEKKEKKIDELIIENEPIIQQLMNKLTKKDN
jgi:hypothetical protein